VSMSTEALKQASGGKRLAVAGDGELAVMENRTAAVVATVMLVVSVIAGMVASYFLAIGVENHSNWKVLITAVSLPWLCVYFVCSFVYYRSLYSFANLYVVVLSLFHLGVTIPDALNVFEKFGWGGGEFEKWLEYSAWYTVLSLGSLGVGTAVALMQRGGRATPGVEKETVEWAKRLVFFDGVGLMLASLVFAGLALASFGNLLAYARVDFFRGVRDTRGLGAFLMVFPGAATLLVIGASNKWQKILSAICAAVGGLLIMLSGYRTYALMPLLVGSVIWVKTGRRIPAAVAGLALAAMFILIPIVGVVRAAGPYKDWDRTTFLDAWNEVSADKVFALGQTGGLLAHVLERVPMLDPYQYGHTYLKGLVDSIPNLTPKIRESSRAVGERQSWNDREAISKMPPSDWITYHLDMWKFRHGEGVGFTGIGEPYLNFGVVGVIVFFVGIGYALARVDGAAILGSPSLLIFLGTMFWGLMRTVRDDMATFFHPSVFVVITLVIWRLFAFPWLPRKPNTWR